MKAQQLKNAILQLAIQGKLVPQNPDDEPASVLLEKIRAEKEQLIREGKIKKSKKTTDSHPYQHETPPFDIPESWEWVRLDDLGSISRGASPRPIESALTNNEDGIPWIKIGDTKFGEKYIYSTKEKITQEASLKSKKVDIDDFLLTNSMSFGRPYITKISGCVHDGWLIIHFNKIIVNLDFMYYLLSSPFIFNQFSDKAAGSAFKNLKSDTVKESLVPLPPLSEQHRIVQKLEEILPLVEHYGKKEEKLTALHQAFPEQLKKSILQAAIQGKLTEQLETDEPATELLKRIQAEKVRLIAEKKIKKPKAQSEIFIRDNLSFEKIDETVRCIADEVPFELPKNWCWVRLGDIGEWGAGATPDRHNAKYYVNGTIPWLKTGDLNDGIIENIPESITDLAVKETSVKLNPIGSVLIAMYGATIGKLGILNIESTTNQACCACSTYNGIYNKFLFYYLMSQKSEFQKRSEGSGQPNISKEKIINYIFPLPPLSEQHRIVEKIETLFSSIENLK